MPEEQLQQIRQLGQMIWASGLPVLDDLHNESYNWQPPSQKSGEKEFNRQAAAKYIEALKNLKPGLTMVIMHCTAPTEVFKHISGSGDVRKADLKAMLDPALKKFIEQEGIILTTWREAMQRRASVK
jgi:chitin disaccharide deacetylase